MSQIQKDSGRDVRKIGFFYGIGTLQFIEALQKGYIDLSQDYVHSYPHSENTSIFLTPIVPGGADAVTVCAHINSMQSHGRELFGFDYDFSKVDMLIQGIHEYNSQPYHPREIRRSLYEFKSQCILNGIPKDKILPYLQLLKLTFKGFIVEFKRDILNQLVISSDEDLYKKSEYRFRFMSNKVPFDSIASYTGVGIIEERFAETYYALLDNYRQAVSKLPDKSEQSREKRIALNDFYLSQAQLIKELKQNIHKQYMIKYD